MTNTKLDAFRVHNLDAEPVNRAFHETTAAIEEQDYAQAITFASNALSKIQELLVVTMLDYRAYAYGMQCNFDEAIKDAKSIIELEPTLAKGYFRLGELYRMQGKKQSAIDAYDLGLQSASPNDPDYAQIISSKESAVKKKGTRVDFVERLPTEVVDEIITLVPTKLKFVCLTVSSVWREKIFQCSNTWKTLASGDGTEADLIMSMIPHIAHHVEDLTINTTDRSIFLRYLLALSADNFGKVKALKLSHNTTKHFNTKMIMPIANAFGHIGKNLTKLVIHLTRNRAMISLVDIISVCPKLKSLEYSAPAQLSHVIGELILLKPQNSLVDMQLKANTITGKDLGKLLPPLQWLRRLLLHGCDTSVLDVVDLACPTLETFGYNPDISEIRRLDHLDVNPSVPGLRRLYTNNGGPQVPAAAILPLIQRNMNTLQILYSNLSHPGPQPDLVTAYYDLRLPNLNKLVFWGEISNTMQPLILRAISSCTMLTHVEAVNCRDISALAQRLQSLPQLEFFNLTRSSVVDDENELQRLFKIYSRDTVSRRRLKTIWLRTCPYTVTQNILLGLSGIDTLESIWFRELSTVPKAAIDNFFKDCSGSMSDIRLAQMDTITDSSLISIGNMKGLKSIHLEKLHRISDHGIIGLVDGALKLQSLTLVNCEFVSQNAISYAQKRLRKVVITE